MSEFFDILQQRLLGKTFPGGSPLSNTIRPSGAGLNWLAVPHECKGLAYRINNGNTLEALSVTGSEISVAHKASIGSQVVNIAASPDGRLVAVACQDGSLRCFNATSSQGLTHRWTVPGAHSHVVSDVSKSPSSSRALAAGESGPVRSLAFTSRGYALLLLDVGKRGLTIYNADSTGTPRDTIKGKMPSNLEATSASWCRKMDGSVAPLAIGGGSDGSISVFHYNIEDTTMERIKQFPFPDDDDKEGWICTHLDWLGSNGNSLAAGYCRVTLDEDESTAHDDEDDDDEEDDDAEHEAQMFTTDISGPSYDISKWGELGDIAPFFGVPKNGRHIFFTSFAETSQQVSFLMVASNVASETALISHRNNGGWDPVEIEEGHSATTPTNDDDEYTYPVGLANILVPSENGVSLCLLVASTDGSLSNFKFVHTEKNDFFLADTATTSASVLPDVPVEEISSNPPELTTEVDKQDEVARPTTASFGKTPTETPVFGAGSAPVFGSTFGQPSALGGPSQATFGQLSTLGGATKPTFGQPSALGGSTESTFGQPSALSGPSKSIFGQPSALGENSRSTFGQPSTLGEPSKSTFGQSSALGGLSKSTFGQPSKATTGFSFGSPPAAQSEGNQPIFGSTSAIGSSPGGFAALAASPSASGSKGFGGFGAVSTTSVDAGNKSTFSIFGKASEKTTDAPKTLFGASSETGGTTKGDESLAPSDSATKVAPTSSASSDKEKSALPVFGSGSKMPVFGSPSGNLFSVPSAEKKSSFNIFEKSSPSAAFPSSMAKPLFGSSPTPAKKEDINTDEVKSSPSTKPKPVIEDSPALKKEETDQKSEKKTEVTPTCPSAKSAARAFESFDKSKSGSIPVACFEDLLDELGEGFHGDEFDKQLQLVDPEGSGKINKSDFINWYVKLTEENSDDDSSLDSEERAEREEEKGKAKSAFLSLAVTEDGVHKVSISDFAKLIESMGTTYCEEEHKRTITKLKRPGDKILLDDFVEWYMGWLFGDEDSDYESEEDEVADTAPSGKGSGGGSGWGDIFKVDKDSWRCDACMVRNPAEDNVCSACDEPKPGHKVDTKTTESKNALSTSGSGIGSGGFTFGGGTTNKGGFSFGTSAADSGSALKTSSTSDETKGSKEKSSVSGSGIGAGGFTFAAGPTSSGGFSFATSQSVPKTSSIDDKPSTLKGSDPATGISSGGFSFGGGSTSTSPSKFSFGTTKLTPLFGSKSSEDETKTSTKPLISEGSASAKQATAADKTSLSSAPPKQKSIFGSEKEQTDSSEKQLTAKSPVPVKAGVAEAADEKATSASAKLATRAFESFDKSKSGSVPVACFEDLLDELGEGFHGDEFDKQLQLVDPEGSGKINKSDFINWYVKLTEENSDDDSSLDSEERAEREEEKGKAKSAFLSLAVAEDGVHKVSISDFAKLIESMGTTYCEEEHKRTITKLKRPGDKILLDDFVEWYMGWLFGDEDSDYESEEDEAADTAPSGKGSGGGSGWGDIFKVDKDSWRCDACMVRNPAEDNVCSACDEPKPGHKVDTKTAESKNAVSTSGSGIGSGGFTFGGGTTNKGGFSFGSPAADSGSALKTSSTSDETKGSKEKSSVSGSGIGAGGFTFAAAQKTSSSSDETKGSKEKPATSLAGIGSGGFTFGSTGGFAFGSGTSSGISSGSSKGDTSTVKSSGFSFGTSAPAAISKPKDSAVTLSKGSGDISKKQESSYPPMATKAPTPFSDSTKAVDSSYPPMATKAPKPFSESSKTADSSYPPMATKAPTPFSGSAKKSESSFPPMSTKAPTPFSASSKVSNSSFPPMSTKAPTPFSASSKVSNSSFPPMSTKAPTPFGVSSKTSESAYPPMATKAPTPFSGSSKKSESSFPPMSTKAPTPFSASSKAADSSYPPMATKAPKPFSASSKTSESAYPPMATKAPTPFGDSSKKSESSFPPMSTKAPTPFSASSKVSNSSFPPMSTKAPTPFGVSSKTSESSYPPMATKAPTPFGDSSKKSESSFPPMSTKAPTPFNASSKVSNSSFPPMSTKAPKPFSASSKTSESSYPPMATKAPTPFGDSSKKSESSFPPMSTKAPTPFSASSKVSNSSFPPMSTKAPTPFGVSSKTSESSFPPMSTKAPTPFGGSSKKSESSFPPMSTKAPTPFSASSKVSNSSFPPMSTKAPTPFGVSSKTSESSFPPMSTKAPTPFSASSKTAESSYPPMATKAPKPFSGSSRSSESSQPSMSNKTTSPFSSFSKGLESSFPPMSTMAPTPFGGLSKAADNSFSAMSAKSPTPFGGSSKAPGSSYPPLSTQSPTPFSGASKSSETVSFGDVSKATVTKTTPFSSVASSGSVTPSFAPKLAMGSPAFSGGRMPRSKDAVSVGSGSSADTRIPSSVAKRSMSEFEALFFSFSRKLNDTLLKTARSRPSPAINEDAFQVSMEANVREVQRMRISCTENEEALARNKHWIAFLLSRNSDASRQATEARRLIDEHRSSQLHDQQEFLKNQPLDRESEENRRQLAAKAVQVHKYLSLFEERAKQMDDISSGAAADGNKSLFQALIKSWDSTKRFTQESCRLERKVGEVSKSVPRASTGTPVQSGAVRSRSGARGREKIEPLTFPGDLASPTGRKPVEVKSSDGHQKAKKRWRSIDCALRNFASRPATKEELHCSVLMSTSSATKALRFQRSSRPKTLCLPSTEIRSPPSSANRAVVTKNIFSPPSGLKSRSGWDSVSSIDQVRAKQMSLSLPKDIQEMTFNMAGREALASFGTTPEKVNSNIGVLHRGVGTNQSPGLTSTTKNSEKERARRKEQGKSSGAASFPPIPTKAPTPVSQKLQENKPQKSTMSYPPLSKKAPTPFSGGGTKSSFPPGKVETPKIRSEAIPLGAEKVGSEKISTMKFGEGSMGFGGMKGLGDALFSPSISSTSTPKAASMPPTVKPDPSGSSKPDYNKLLTSFYQQHNPSKVVEVRKTLEKYKGREAEMFAKLAKKYGVQNPLANPETASSPGSKQNTPGFSSFPMGGTSQGKDMNQSPFAAKPSQGKDLNQSPFTAKPHSAPSPSPFGSTSGKGNAPSAPSPSPFGSTSGKGNAPSAPSPSPFGSTSGKGNASSSSMFGQMNTPTPAFGSGNLSSTTPFGQSSSQSMTQAQPFGTMATQAPAAAPSVQPSFQGRNPREMLVAFYQQYNAAKVAEVDKLLTKYKGDEERMFRNLAKKYNLDPSYFGLSAAPNTAAFNSPNNIQSPGFGQPSMLGGGPTFGGGNATASPFGGSMPASSGFGGTPSIGQGMSPGFGGGGANASGGQAFGSSANSGFGTSSFGSLAKSTTPSPFGAPTGGFGSAAPSFGAPSVPQFGATTPFGAPRR